MEETEAAFFDTQKIVGELWNELQTNGVYGRSKTDFYDYILYLLNKYDANHFLSSNDNATNERLLKITAARIKTAKKNISVKFMDNSEYEKIFQNFIQRIANGNIPSLEDNGKSYTMVIEDTALRSIIEAKLKRIANTTLDYKLNTELVTISHKAFVELLATESENSPENIKDFLKNFLKTLKDNESKNDIKQMIKTVIDSGSFETFGLNALKAIAQFIYKKFENIKK